MKKFIKTWGLLLAFIVGGLLPSLHVLAWSIPYCVGSMLVITFLGMNAQKLLPQKRHVAILAATVLLGVSGWAVLRAAGEPELAEAAFFSGILGVAAGAPVIVQMLGGKSEFAATALVLSSISSSVVISLLAPFVISSGGVAVSRWDVFCAVLQQVSGMLLVPCIIAYLLRHFYPASKEWSARLSGVSLGIWLLTMAVISASAVVRVAGQPWRALFPYAAVSLVLCICGFTLGRLIGGRKWGFECAQCLGQKNTTVGIYLAMVYSAPLVFLGPALYLFFHHIYNTYQLARYNMRRRRA